MLEPGTRRLRQRVTIELITQNRSASGDYIPSLQTVATVWVDFGRASGWKETAQAGTRFAEMTYPVLMRYRAGITANMRIRLSSIAATVLYGENLYSQSSGQDRIFDIVGVDDTAQRQQGWMTLYVREQNR